MQKNNLQNAIPNTRRICLKCDCTAFFKVLNCVGVKQWHPCKFPVPTMNFQKKKDPSHWECLLYSPYAIRLWEQKGGAHAAWPTKVIESLPLSHIRLLPLIKALMFAVLRVYLSAPCGSWDALKEWPWTAQSNVGLMGNGYCQNAGLDWHFTHCYLGKGRICPCPHKGSKRKSPFQIIL